jgi:hypothetical protein
VRSIDFLGFSLGPRGLRGWSTVFEEEGDGNCLAFALALDLWMRGDPVVDAAGRKWRCDAVMQPMANILRNLKTTTFHHSACSLLEVWDGGGGGSMMMIPVL